MSRSSPALPLALLIALSACADMQASLDRRGLRETAAVLAAPTAADAPHRLRALVRDHDLARDTAPRQVTAAWGADLPDWTVTLSDGREITPRLLTFPSVTARKDQRAQAVFYFYQPQRLEGGKAVLWAPGMGIAPYARPFIARFFRAALDEGHAVLLWVPPYHLQRVAPGGEPGEGFLTSDPADNIALLLQGVRELRLGHAWLRSQGIARVGGWGGSMGASLLMLLSRVEALDHLAVMIPVLDWRALALDQPAMRPAVTALVAHGHTEALLRQAYGLVSPAAGPLGLDPGRVVVLAASHDQLTPAALTRRWVRTQGIDHVHWFDRSHATVLLDGALGPTYARALRRWARPGP